MITLIIGARAMERTLVQGGLKSNHLNSKSTTAKCYLRYSWYLRYLAPTRASLLVLDQLLVTQRVAPDHSYHSHCLLRSFPQRVALARA